MPIDYERMSDDLHDEWIRLCHVAQDKSADPADRAHAYKMLPVLHEMCTHAVEQLLRVRGFGHYVGGGFGPADPDRPFVNPDRPWVLIA